VEREIRRSLIPRWGLRPITEITIDDLVDLCAEFKKRGAVILGVSPDSVKSHDKFVKKFSLPFTLLADEDKKIVEAYGVWGMKIFWGRKYLGTHRVTFLIGPDGRIKKIWPDVKPEEHAKEVLAALE